MPSREAKFKAISEAYDCLKDPQKRAAYDRFGHAAFQNGGGGFGGRRRQPDFGDIGDIFETIFGSAFGGGARQQPRRGADLRYDMQITLEEAFHGKDAEDRGRGLGRLRPLRRHRREPGHRPAQLQPVRRPRQGARAAGPVRDRAAMPDLPRRAAR